MRPRFVLACLLALLPNTAHRLLGKWLLGWDVHPSAVVGHSIVDARHVSLGPGAHIGSLSVIKGLEELAMAENAYIGQFNWISGPPLSTGLFPASPNRQPRLLLGKESGIIQRHLVDCSDTVELGDFALVSGSRSSILTHSVNLVTSRQMTSPVRIGERSALLHGSIMLAGTSLAARSIVSAGSVVITPLTSELTLYRGNPAESVRDLPASLGLFNRTGPA